VQRTTKLRDLSEPQELLRQEERNDGAEHSKLKHILLWALDASALFLVFVP
jgi:hypothetical protein